jgi:hypothetical protein
MPQEILAARYRAVERLAGGRCPIEAGLICRRADHDAATGGSRSTTPPPCGCWSEEGAVVRPLTELSGLPKQPQSQRVAERACHSLFSFTADIPGSRAVTLAFASRGDSAGDRRAPSLTRALTRDG